MMNITDFFAIKLGAPFRNAVWSWGSVRESDNTVFLRVWQDRKIREGGATYMMITHHSKYEDVTARHGYEERLEHVSKIEGGATCYLVMCEVVDPKAARREIKGYNDREVFAAGEAIERGGDTYVRLAQRIPVANVRTPQ